MIVDNFGRVDKEGRRYDVIDKKFVYAYATLLG